MVGLPDASVRESRDRVRSAIRNSGFEFPPHRITVNLAPADVRKAGSSFDLPIALGVLAAAGHRRAARHRRRRAARRAVARRRRSRSARGVLPIAAAARRDGCRALLLPHPNARRGGGRRRARALSGAIAGRSGRGAQPTRRAFARRRLRPPPVAHRTQLDGDFADVRGQVARAARARDRRGRRPQRAARRAAGRRQDDDGAAAARASCRR